MFKKSLLVVSVAAALSLAGCGGGSGGGGTTSSPVVASSKIAGAAAQGIVKKGIVTAYELPYADGNPNEGVEKPKSDHPIQIGQSFF